MTSLPIHPDQERPAADGATAPISETFVSIQGEGKLTGVASWFVRLAGCNLRCRWCDTPYASWSPESVGRTVESLLAEFDASGVRHAVLTGGEPMLFRQLLPLTEGLARRGAHITIETAGTVTLAGVHCHLMSVSPKLANSTPTGDPRDPSGKWAARHDERRLNFDSLNELMACAPDRQLKFVVSSPGDLAEIDGVLARVRGWRPDDIVLMPEGTTVPSAESVRWVVETCVRRGWRYGDRLHIRLFGDTMGT